MTRLAVVLSIFFAIGIGRSQESAGFHPTIPKTWIDAEIASLEVPLANPMGSPKHIAADYYYRIPVRPIYRTYPRYRPGKEPPGYMEWLRGRAPEIVFDPAGLKSEQNWIRAGEIVFHYPVDLSPDLPGAESEAIRRSRDLFGKDDISPFVSYVVRKKGVVEFGTASCADCHTRVMPDGSLLVGASYDGFIPLGNRFRELPAPSTQERYSDEQLYALALYIYSLKPPANPNRFEAEAVKGQQVFRQQGCAGCHPPPLYTNNKLVPVAGFRVSEDLKTRFDVLPVPIGTDLHLTMETRRGTGFYKVPSLRGLWYRGPFEHNGSVATLEDWFDPRRLRDDYAPTGFEGYHIETRAIKGHEFGLNLSTGDRAALIAFLKTF